MTISLFALATQGITWIKVESPKLDVVGVILGSLGLAGALAVLALVLGGLLGLTRIVRAHRQRHSWADDHASLGLGDSRA